MSGDHHITIADTLMFPFQIRKNISEMFSRFAIKTQDPYAKQNLSDRNTILFRSAAFLDPVNQLTVSH